METVILYITLFVVVLTLLWKRLNRPKLKLVGHVTEIRTHPMKSAKPLQLEEVEVNKLGLKYDRQFALLNQYGTFTTLRKFPKFVLIKQEILEDTIRLRADGMQDLYLPLNMEKKDGDHVADVTVWKIKTQGVHVSEEADEWFAKYLNLDGCKLYCFPQDGLPRITKDKGYGKFEMMFADGCPLLILSEASLTELNERYVDEELTMDRFRPNIVINGCGPYNEDVFGQIQIGRHVIMKGLWACERCVAINVDPLKGEMSPFNLSAFLNKNRPGTIYNPKAKDGIFGCNYGVQQAGIIKIGDPVYKILH